MKIAWASQSRPSLKVWHRPKRLFAEATVKMTTHIRMFGLLHTYRKKQGLSSSVELLLPSEGRTARSIARELELPIEKIEAVFCNNTIYCLDHLIMPGDRVAFVPVGVPGPHRYCLGIKQAGDKNKKCQD